MTRAAAVVDHHDLIDLFGQHAQILEQLRRRGECRHDRAHGEVGRVRVDGGTISRGGHGSDNLPAGTAGTTTAPGPKERAA